MTHHKYPSLGNIQFSNFLEKFRTAFPELEHETYVIQEKLDGTNMQLFFQPHKAVIVGNRNRLISVENDHFDFVKHLDKFPWLQKAQQYVDKHGVTIRLYGEHYGKGISSVVDYGKVHYFTVFDLERNGRMLTPKTAQILCKMMGIEKNFIRFMAIVKGLYTALAYNENFKTTYGRSTEIEAKAKPYQFKSKGIVIKPLKECRVARIGRLIAKSVSVDYYASN